MEDKAGWQLIVGKKKGTRYKQARPRSSLIFQIPTKGKLCLTITLTYFSTNFFLIYFYFLYSAEQPMGYPLPIIKLSFQMMIGKCPVLKYKEANP